MRGTSVGLHLLAHPGGPRMRGKKTFATIDEYLRTLTREKRESLTQLRRAIIAAAPHVQECISYQIPAFRVNGKLFMAFCAAKNHCSFFPMSSKLIIDFQDSLKKYETSKGTIRFPIDEPLSAALVRKFVKARLIEHARKYPSVSATSSRTAACSNLKAPARSKPEKLAPGSKMGSDAGVAAFLRDLDHPRKKDVEAVRRIILGVSPTITEGIKWNAPSFRTKDYFATVNLRDYKGETRVWLILHTGAKSKARSMSKIPDPSGLLTWLAKDRALMTFADGKDVRSKRPALEAIVRNWISRL